MSNIVHSHTIHLKIGDRKMFSYDEPSNSYVKSRFELFDNFKNKIFSLTEDDNFISDSRDVTIFENANRKINKQFFVIFYKVGTYVFYDKDVFRNGVERITNKINIVVTKN